MDMITDILAQTDFSFVLEQTDAEHKWTAFARYIKATIDLAAPQKSIKKKNGICKNKKHS
jgi:hypothetical protein